MYNELGAVYSSLDKFTESLVSYDKSVTIYIKHYGPKNATVGIMYHNIASLLKSVGRHEDAINYYNKSLEIDKDSYGANHKYIA